MNRWVRLAIFAALAVAVGAVVYSANRSKALPAPAQTVQAVLRLRAANSTDATGYARYFEATSVAGALAENAAGRKGKGSPVPQWRRPKVRSSSETSASVVVEWRPSAKFKGWASSTTFTLAKIGGRWVIVDAVENPAADATKTP
jgi:hypothetical protein